VGYLGLKLDWESAAAIGVRNAAERLGMTLLHAGHTPPNYDDAFAFIAREQLHGLFVARNPWNFSNRRAITGFATDRWMAAVYPTREFAEVAGLISYGPSLFDLYRRAAGHVDKILKGAKAAELPVEQPTKFELVINFKTARALGLTILPTLLARRRGDRMSGRLLRISEMGQNRESSMRVNDFRYTPESRHRLHDRPCPKSARSGRPQEQVFLILLNARLGACPCSEKKVLKSASASRTPGVETNADGALR
jgi:hypothetical protein